MSSTDTRIVQMKFDNAQFLQGSQQTQDSMTKLKASLNVDGQASSLQNLQDVGNKFNLDGMASALDNISSHFGAMGAIGFSVLNDITTQALNTGEQLLNSLVQPLIEGGRQRSLNISQAEFQFQGLGLDVTSTMASALAAVKGTAYGLDQAALAAANLGAAGVKSGADMTNALTAISGTAAITGQSYSQIADIFSTVAGNTRLYSEQLLQLADNGVDAAAVLAKALGKTEPQIRQMVTDGKISFAQFSDAMDEAFGSHAKDADKTFEGALANMQAALARIGQIIWDPILEGERVVFNALSPAIDNLHTAVTPLITAFGKLFGAQSLDLVTAIHNIDFTALTQAMPGIVKLFNDLFTAVRAFVLPLKEAFEEIFPPATAQTLINIVTYLDNLVKGMTIAGTNAENLRKTFAGIFAIFDIVRQVIVALVQAFFSLVGATGPADSGILTFTGSIGQFLVNLDAAIKQGNVFTKFFQTIVTVLKIPIELITNLVGIIVALVQALFTLNPKPVVDFADTLSTKFAGLIKVANFLKDAFSVLIAILKSIGVFLEPFVNQVVGLFQKVGPQIMAALNNLNFTQFLQLVNTALLGGFVLIIRGFFGHLGGIINGNGVAFVTKFKNIFTQMQITFKAFEYNLNAKTLFSIAAAIALLTASVVALSLVNADKLKTSLTAMATMMASLVGALIILKKAEGVTGAGGLLVMSLGLNLLATAMDTLSISVIILAKLNWNDLVKGLTGLTVILAEIIVTAKLMSSNAVGMIAGGIGLEAMSVGILILSAAITIIAKLSWSKMVEGLTAVGAILAELALFNKLNTVNAASLISSVGLIALAGALNIIANVVEDLSTYSIEALVKGEVALAAILAVLAGFSKISDFGPSFLLTATGLVIMGAALSIIAGVMEKIGQFSWEELGKGLLGLTGSIAVMVLALSILTPSSILGAAALVIVSAALLIVASTMQKMGEMSWDQIGRAFTVMAGSLLLMVGILALFVLTGVAPALVAAGALIIAAGAILIIAGAMKIFGSLSWDQIGRALTLLASSLVILAVGGALLIVAIPGFLGLALALLLIGAAMKTLGTGVLDLAKGLLLLSVAGGSGALAIGLLLAAITKALPALGLAWGKSFIGFLSVIANSLPQLVAALTTLIISAITAMTNLLPKIVDFAVLFITTLINALVVLLPLLANAGLTILVGILNGIKDNLNSKDPNKNVVTIGLAIVTGIINGIAAGLPGLAQAGAHLVISFIQSIADALDDPKNVAALHNALGSLAGSIVSGLTDGLISPTEVQKVISAVSKLVKNIPATIRSILDINSPSKVTASLGESVGEGLANGITKGTSGVVAATTGIGNSAITALKKSISGAAMSPDLLNMNPTIKPVLDLTTLTKQASLIPGMITPPPLSLSIGTSTQAANAAAVSVQATQDLANNQNDSNDSQDQSAGIIYNQYNSSPVALSPVEIYRQTNNQLSKKKEELANAQ